MLRALVPCCSAKAALAEWLLRRDFRMAGHLSLGGVPEYPVAPSRPLAGNSWALAGP